MKEKSVSKKKKEQSYIEWMKGILDRDIKVYRQYLKEEEE